MRECVHYWNIRVLFFCPFRFDHCFLNLLNLLWQLACAWLFWVTAIQYYWDVIKSLKFLNPLWSLPTKEQEGDWLENKKKIADRCISNSMNFLVYGMGDQSCEATRQIFNLEHEEKSGCSQDPLFKYSIGCSNNLNFSIVSTRLTGKFNTPTSAWKTYVSESASHWASVRKQKTNR